MENGVIEVTARRSSNFRKSGESDPAPTEAELRAKLREAIEARNSADCHRRDREGRATRRAEDLRLEASRAGGRVRATHAERATEAREAHVREVSGRRSRQAGPFQAGHPSPPSTPPPWPPWRTEHDTLQVTAAYLGLESNQAAADAAREAASEVHAAAVAIIDYDMQRKHAETIAAKDILERLIEDMSGFHIMDSRRPGGAKFVAMKDELAIRLDREAALMAGSTPSLTSPGKCGSISMA